MRDLPIIFSGSMVRALLEGRKTMTRRLLKPQPEPFKIGDDEWSPVSLLHIEGDPRPRITLGRVVTRQEVRFGVGDRLWVRENFYVEGGHDANGFGYAADLRPQDGPPKLCPSIHMPRHLSRITLLITAVKVERVQEISYADAIAEGMPDFAAFLSGNEVDPPPRDREGAEECARRLRWPQRWFEGVWESLHGRANWDANPFIVALTFAVRNENIDALVPAAA